MERHSNVELFEKTYRALINGDRQTLEQLVLPEARFHVPGRNIISGEYQGIDAALFFFNRLVSLTEESYRREQIDVLAGKTHVAAIIHVTARHGGRRLDLMVIFAEMIQDDRVAEMRAFISDQAAWDAFWSDQMLTATPTPDFQPPQTPIAP